MDRTLAISKRPRRLSELVGQDTLVSQLRAQFDGKVPNALMFSGSPGTGKTTLARIVATSLQCAHAPFGEPCDACLARRWDDISEINASELNGVDAVKSIVEGTTYYPREGGYKIIILDEAQRLTVPAQNVLLKPAEDAAAHLVWIFATTEPTKIVPALRRRCVPFVLGGLDREGIVALLDSAAEMPDEKVTELADALDQNSVSSPGIVIQALEKVLAGTHPIQAAAMVSGEAASIDTLEICRAVMNGRWSNAAPLLAQAKSEDARPILAAVAGYLRSCLIRKPDANIAKAILALTAPLPFEDGLAWSTTVARVYQAASIMGASR